MSETGGETPGPRSEGYKPRENSEPQTEEQSGTNQSTDIQSTSDKETGSRLKAIRNIIGKIGSTFDVRDKEVTEEDMTIEDAAVAISLASGQHTRIKRERPIPFESIAVELGLHGLDPEDPRAIKLRKMLFDLAGKGAISLDKGVDSNGDHFIQYSVREENAEILKSISESDKSTK